MSYYSFEELLVLLVDDNVRMRRLMRTIMQGLGAANILEADGGEEALRLLRTVPVDIVICDMIMAPMDGVTFVGRVRNDAESPNRFLPIIMASAYSEPDRVIAARDAGVNEFLAKPLSVSGVYRRVMSVIERPRPFVRAAGYFGPARRGIDRLDQAPARAATTVELLDG